MCTKHDRCMKAFGDVASRWTKSFAKCAHAMSMHGGLGWFGIPLTDFAFDICIVYVCTCSTWLMSHEICRCSCQMLISHVLCIQALDVWPAICRHQPTDVCRLCMMLEGHILHRQNYMRKLQTILEGHVRCLQTNECMIWTKFSGTIRRRKTNKWRLRMIMAAHIWCRLKIVCIT